jgi:hypothetical protein
MCKQILTTHTSCLHVDRYTDRMYNHNRYYKSDVERCAQLKVERMVVEGVCGSCLLAEEEDERLRALLGREIGAKEL